MSGSGFPEWVTKRCEAKGIRPSQRGLAEAAGTYAPTVKRVLEGRGDPESNAAVAHALGMDLRDFYRRIGGSNELGPWVPPAEAHLLGAAEREALGVIVRAMAREGGTNAEPAAAPEKTPDDGGGPRAGVSHLRPAPPPGNITDLAAGSHHGRAKGRITRPQDDAGNAPDPDGPEFGA